MQFPTCLCNKTFNNNRIKRKEAEYICLFHGCQSIVGLYSCSYCFTGHLKRCYKVVSKEYFTNKIISINSLPEPQKKELCKGTQYKLMFQRIQHILKKNKITHTSLDINCIQLVAKFLYFNEYLFNIEKNPINEDFEPKIQEQEKYLPQIEQEENKKILQDYYQNLYRNGTIPNSIQLCSQEEFLYPKPLHKSTPQQNLPPTTPLNKPQLQQPQIDQAQLNAYYYSQQKSDQLNYNNPINKS